MDIIKYKNIMSLSKIYYDPLQGFLSAKKLYDKVKEYGYTLKEVKDFINSQETYQVNKQTHKPKQFT